MSAQAKPSSTQRLEQALAAIDQAGDEGRRTFTRLYTSDARAAAAAADARSRAGRCFGPMDGRLVSIKDLFDVAGEPTTAGSVILQDAAPATRDATVVRRLRAAGAVIVGKTNMTEFAFSGVGINPHYGTPGNSRDAARIPGGSSSGAGVSVARNFVEIAIGSDTGGSVRIPAALNGIVGFKPTQARVPREGAFPLSYSLDTIGPLCHNVADALAADAMLSGVDLEPGATRSVPGLRLGIPRGLMFTEAQTEVLEAFDRAMALLGGAGARLSDEAMDDLLGEPFRLQEQGTLAAAEAASIHQHLLKEHPEAYDPIVLGRIRHGETIGAARYITMVQARTQLLRHIDARLAGFDALVLPTVPLLAPRIDALSEERAFLRTNGLLLRNPSVFNFFDLPALSLPAPTGTGLPVGLMLVGRRGADRDLLAIGSAIESVLTSANR
ncbi:amidase [Hydrogenophaga crassostreae]|uniref:Amidase n=1 Tax=Hydrogenophaga crassostreae TaxID=1763535 RepID=A0A163CKK9_9BURK|nr:amidase [Hydrogenophaga crassostreae]AOW14705.1 amidase [Hydrogenophaga crassostreae]OAD43199.1 amidase [Hydrogenophaga crassostreae]